MENSTAEISAFKFCLEKISVNEICVTQIGVL